MIVEDNVVGFPALAGVGPAVGPDRVVQPGRAQGPARPAVLVGLPGRGPSATGRRSWPRCDRTHRDMWADFDAFSRDHGDHGLRYGPLGPDFIAESPWLNLYLYPAEADYARASAARADLAPPRFLRPGRRHDVGAARSPARARRCPDLPVAGLPRLGGRRADAAAGRPAGDDRAPGHRLEGPAGRPDHASTTTRSARGSCRSRRSCRRSTW